MILCFCFVIVFTIVIANVILLHLLFLVDHNIRIEIRITGLDSSGVCIRIIVDIGIFILKHFWPKGGIVKFQFGIWLGIRRIIVFFWRSMQYGVTAWEKRAIRRGHKRRCSPLPLPLIIASSVKSHHPCWLFKLKMIRVVVVVVIVSEVQYNK